MKLQTQIPLSKQPDNNIDYESKLVLLGSCFAENMAEKFEYYKFQATTNPFGIIFNPIAIGKIIERCLNKYYFTDEDVFYHNEQWQSYDVHSKLSNPSKEDLLKQLNNLIDLTAQQLYSATHIIITFGTSWVYKLNSSNQIVANCHKVPQSHFTKVLLSIEEITTSLQRMIKCIQSINPNAKFIFTVSPVRHIKDGFVENTLSKSHLISSTHQFISQQSLINNLQSFYFPSFELMMDELRDYRFYTDDMMHPNQTAINYIWEKFNDVWIHPEASKTMAIVDSIQKGLQHKPFNPQTQAHQAFLEDLEVKKQTLQDQFPYIVF
uniref:GSCFA domain-containing protein n=1 Tax=Gelidibacter sp. TaxID=2018083 RepID=UPI00404B5C24